MRRAREQSFGKVKAAKANARARVGRPAPERVIEDPKRKQARSPRYRETLQELLGPQRSRGDGTEQEEVR